MMLKVFNRNLLKFCKNKDNKHLTVFSAKSYDQQYFLKINQALPEQKRFKFYFFDAIYNARMSRLIPNTSNTVICFVNDSLDSNGIKALKENNVDLIALRCTGFNNVDLKQAKKQGITIVRVPAYSPHAVAEYTMALLMTLNTKTHKAYNRTRENNFSLEGLLGFDMYGKTIGIIGFGKIGKQVVKICNGYGMKVLVNDIAVPQEKVSQIEREFNIKFVDRNQIFEKSDIISLHCPLTPKAKYMINKQAIDRMQKHCIIINTGRGQLIDTKEVSNALAQRKIGGLALDVYQQQEGLFFRDLSSYIIKDQVLAQLMSYPNVILTSHQGFFTHQALTQICKVTLNNIIQFRETGKCKNQVKNPDK